MRTKTNFDADWKFYLGDIAPHKPTDSWGGAKARGYLTGAASVNFDDTDWRDVTLPHDFVSEGKYSFDSGDNSDMVAIPEMESIDSRLFAGGCLEGGVAWYRKKFYAENSKDKRTYIHFGGVYRDSAVYVNQYYVGSHTSGYTSFSYDITDFITDGENTIAVRVDATGREGWWYEGGGIYRHVWLETVDQIHIKPNSLFAFSKNIDLEQKTANLELRFSLLNRTFSYETVRAQVQIHDADNKIVSKTDCNLSVNEWDETEYRETLLLENIKLWDINSPHLYTASVCILKDEHPLDEYSVKFGIRDIRFDADKGFFLNGRHIKIKGVCCHHDHAGVGIAIPDSINEYRIRRMMDMGANALRSSHYPASEELLDICDRLGMLVFSETRRMSSSPEDIECLKSMVRQDRNHPSIFLWGIGNEEIFSQHRAETARTTLTLKAEIRKLDPSRPITSAVVCWDGEQRYDNAEKYVDVTKNLDIMGFNYCHAAWDDYHTRMPNQPIIVTEESSNSWTRSCYSTDESRGQYYTYDADNFNKCKAKAKAVRKDMGENAWKAVNEREYLAGLFVWTGIDYRGEPTPLHYPAVYSQFGICDYCGFPKDNYYYYQSHWADEDVLHIFPNINAKTENETVYCYSNFDEVEIIADGKSLGRKEMPKDWYLSWENVTNISGEILARGYRNGVLTLEKTFKAADAPQKIEITPQSETVNNGDAAIFNIAILDKNGMIVPTADNKLTFDINGGTLLGTGNGNSGDHDSEKTNERRAFGGLCQVIVRADKDSEITITAKSDGLHAAKTKVSVKGI